MRKFIDWIERNSTEITLDCGIITIITVIAICILEGGLV